MCELCSWSSNHYRYVKRHRAKDHDEPMDTDLLKKNKSQVSAACASKAAASAARLNPQTIPSQVNISTTTPQSTINQNITSCESFESSPKLSLSSGSNTPFTSTPSSPLATLTVAATIPTIATPMDSFN